MAAKSNSLRKMVSCELRRFEKYIEIAGGCWNWTGGLASHGYGQFVYSAIGTRLRQQARAHRVAYRQWKGKIPDGLVVDHLCMNKRCVNPDHLEAVTARENIIRSVRARGIVKKVKVKIVKPLPTHCRNGHEWSPINTIIVRLGKNRPIRTCRTCLYARQMKMYYRKRGLKAPELAYTPKRGVMVGDMFQVAQMSASTKAAAGEWPK